jgi:hypothetical protein
VTNAAPDGKFLHPRLLFTAFKYTVYLLLGVDTLLFFQEDLAASAAIFGGAVGWHNVVEAFTAAIDTAAWLILLLLFELETAVISDDKLRGGLSWLMSGIRAVCYIFIVGAFYGYVTKYGVVSDLSPFSVADVCSLAGGDWNWVSDLDEYPPIDAQSCALLQGRELLQLSGTNVIGTRGALDAAQALAIIDIINSGTWLIIVVLLEAEVWMQLKDRLTARLLQIGKYVKGFFYALLFVCAIYWWFYGDFLDFWDAFLWLVAFIFIELNIFRWHEETEDAAGRDAAEGGGNSEHGHGVR